MISSKLEFDFSELRGRIRTKVGSEGEYAKQIGRTPQFVSNVFNGNSLFGMPDIKKSCVLLDIPLEQIGFFFYTEKVHKSEQTERS